MHRQPPLPAARRGRRPTQPHPPETIHPSTATELLEQILARDEMARSATTLQRDQITRPSGFAEAAARYVDASRWLPKTWPDVSSWRRWRRRPSRLCPV